MSRSPAGMVYLVGAGPGDPGLLTLRAAELLARADVVLHDALVPPAILRLASSAATLIDGGKRSADAATTQAGLQQLLIEHARAGRTVVRLKGGDPYVFGRGGEEAEALAAAGIRFEVVPGVSSFSAVASYAGIPLTHRGKASAFTVLSGHEDPGTPDAAIDWSKIAAVHGTKIILMAVERLASITAALTAGGLPGQTPAAAIHWGTTGAQTTIEGSLANIAQRAQAARLEAPAVLVVGDVVGLRPHLNWFEHRALSGRSVLVPRTRSQPSELVRRLAELGAEVIEAPTGEVAPPAQRDLMIDALAGLGEYDWIVFTSVTAVDSFFTALHAAYDDIRSIGNLRIAAVDAPTASRVAAFHLRVDAQAAENSPIAIARTLADAESLENLRILLARREGASPELPRELENAGAIVDDIPIYRITPLTDPDATWVERLQRGVDWIVFASRSTVTTLHRCVDLKKLQAAHPSIRLASIGPETTQALTALGLKPSLEAKPHTLEAFVDAIGAASNTGAAR